MASISVSGTGSAAPIPAWMTLARRFGAALIIVAMLPAATPDSDGTEVDVRFDNVRNNKGLIRACLTREPRYFPRCERDPQSHKLSIPAGEGATLSFTDVTPGEYAIAALHDENEDGKPNMTLGIPREGIGFSRNPRVRLSVPEFAEVRFPVGAAPVAQQIHMRYFL